jgi:uncharacterized membrane protein YgcG
MKQVLKNGSDSEEQERPTGMAYYRTIFSDLDRTRTNLFEALKGLLERGDRLTDIEKRSEELDARSDELQTPRRVTWCYILISGLWMVWAFIKSVFWWCRNVAREIGTYKMLKEDRDI